MFFMLKCPIPLHLGRQKKCRLLKIWQEKVFTFHLNDKNTTHLTGRHYNLTGGGRTNPL